MVARVCLVASCLAGCDRLFGLSPLDPPVDGQVDGAGMTSDALDADPARCPATYDITFETSTTRYRHVTAGRNWLDAQNACAADLPGRTHLVVLDDDVERVSLVSALEDRGFVGTFWIGLSDRRSENVFLWVTLQPVGMPPRTTPPWGAGQPDNQNGAQHCVRIQGMQSGGQWGLFDDAECAATFEYICECDDYAPATDNY